MSLSRGLLSNALPLGSLLRGVMTYCLLAWAGSAAVAEDAVHLHPAQGQDKGTVVRGTIERYDRDQLKIVTHNGEVSLPTDRIQKVETTWPEPYHEALRKIEQRKFAEALTAVDAALEIEQRTWAHEALVARKCQILLQLNEVASAGVLFLRIVEENPNTRHLEAMPLAWTSNSPSFDRDRAARSWLSGNSLPSRLMGASWLLSSSDRNQAITSLRQLARAEDAQLALLAQAQMWRTEVVTVDESGLRRWVTLLERGNLPGSASAGPWYVIGRALLQQKRYDEAPLPLMRVPILYPGEAHLAAESLLLAARSLERDGQTAEARQLVREIMTEHSGSAASREAEILMEQLNSGGN